MDTDNRVAPLFTGFAAKLATSHVLQSNKNKTYRGRGKRLSVSIVNLQHMLNRQMISRQVLGPS